MAGLDTSGFDAVLARLDSMGNDARKIQDKALKKAGEVMLDDMKSNAPVMTGKGKTYLKVGKAEFKNGKRVVQIGLTKGDVSKAFYLKFAEWGTSKRAAKPFVAPAFHRNKSQAMEILRNEIRQALGL